MSASNWEICPRCLHNAGADADPEKFRTLREDYEWWVDDTAAIRGDYACHCEVCSLTGRAAAHRHLWSAS